MADTATPPAATADSTKLKTTDNKSGLTLSKQTQQGLFLIGAVLIGAWVVHKFILPK